MIFEIRNKRNREKRKTNFGMVALLSLPMNMCPYISFIEGIQYVLY